MISGKWMGLLALAALLAQPIAAQAYASIDSTADPKAISSTISAGLTQDENAPAVDSAAADAMSPLLAEAEALYATGVIANLEERWHDAQVSFEQAIAILGELEVSIDLSADSVSTAGGLLADIITDYRQTLIALGELDEDASISAVMLLFEADGFGAGSDLIETDVIEAPDEDEPVTYDFPIELNDQVRNCIVYYQTVAREPFERFLARAGRYLPMMKEIVASYDMPTDLAYLPLVESGFNNKAYSYAHAAGPWQFISSTGRKYGLHSSWWVDERRDFEKSTHAACRYLKDLYGMFDSWALALAAYNGGEGRVGRQIRRQNTRDFWKLRLHQQTRNYVPLFMAALTIAKEPERYGFYIEPDPPLDFEWVATNKALELKDVARAIQCPADVLTELNPELRRLVTPPDVVPYRFRVPVGHKEVFSDAYKTLKASERTEWVRHTVRRGETISYLARRYGVQVAEIVRANKLRSAHRISVGQTLTIPVPLAYSDNRSEPASSSSSSSSSSSVTASAPSTGMKYTVRRGDSLWKLAKQFGTTTSAIRRANNMGAGSQLIAGATIFIPGKSGGSASQGNFWYTIRHGDTISRIARRFGVSIREILGANGLSDPDRISVGQRIRIPRGM